ncbi:MAG: hypothetical protein BroJett018_52020 [Chloroflexota bacterium]|nr:hypothetical protein [Chloroflexota bacterium]GIK67408.1 MAG: hypothetical protein BroJett018_52020 [Chloroflexota bacterium]
MGVIPIAGRFDPSVNHDCLGVIHSAFLPPYTDVAFSLYYTCSTTGGNPTLYTQWLSMPLPDSAGFTGTYQFVAGDFGTDGNSQPNFIPDGIDTIAVRRGPFVAFSNTPVSNHATFPTAQYFGDPNGGDSEYGYFVAGDWNTDGLDSFGLYYYSNGIPVFYRRNNLDWNLIEYTAQYLPNNGSTFNVATWREP